MSDGEAMVDAAIGGLGLAQLPVSQVRDAISKGLLKAVLQPDSAVDVDFHAVWPRQAHLSPRMRYVIDRLVALAAQGRLQ